MAGIITKGLTRDLSDEEIEEKGKELSSAVIKLRKIQDCKSRATKGFKEKLKVANADVDLLTAIVSEGKMPSEVACKYVFNYPNNGQKQLLRMDDGEEIGSPEPMTDEEKAGNLFEKESGSKSITEAMTEEDDF